MYITVVKYNKETLKPCYYNTKFDCAKCAYGDNCRESGYKRNCAFYDNMRQYFRVISQVPYFTTGEPHLMYINLLSDGKVSLDQAKLRIEETKRFYSARTK